VNLYNDIINSRHIARNCLIFHLYSMSVLIISVLFYILFTLILLFIPLGQMGELSDNICPVLSVHVKLST
jgi:hypothetical protein